MTAFIVPDDGSGRIVTFDVIENEGHESVVEVSDHPVEKGSNITDHVRPTPDRLTLAAYTSNQPIIRNPFTQRGEIVSKDLDIPTWTPPIEPTPGSLFRNAVAAVDGLLFGAPQFKATVLDFPDPFNAILETYEVLLELQRNAVLCRILTAIRFYDGMILERVAAPRTAGDSGVMFGIDIRQIRIVESGQVAAPPVPADDVPGGKPLQNKGGQGAKPRSTAENAGKSDSIAKQIKDGRISLSTFGL